MENHQVVRTLATDNAQRTSADPWTVGKGAGSMGKVSGKLNKNKVHTPSLKLYNSLPRKNQGLEDEIFLWGVGLFLGIVLVSGRIYLFTALLFQHRIEFKMNQWSFLVPLIGGR